MLQNIAPSIQSFIFKNPPRGALIALEGRDNIGKTTEGVRLTTRLNKNGVKTELWRYPDRSTQIGGILDKFLKREIELNQQAAAMLFTANRWESVRKMIHSLNKGVNIILDRYSYSGISYAASSSKMCIELV